MEFLCKIYYKKSMERSTLTIYKVFKFLSELLSKAFASMTELIFTVINNDIHV